MLNNIVDNLEQCGSKTLFNAVFIRPEQVVHFWQCIAPSSPVSTMWPPRDTLLS